MAFVITAVATAVELGTFAAIATAVSEVGITMSVVGAVTGNKELTKWGGYLGIAGGIGSLASSAFSTAATEAATDSAIGSADLGSGLGGTTSSEIGDLMGTQGAIGDGYSASIGSAISDPTMLGTASADAASIGADSASLSAPAAAPGLAPTSSAVDGAQNANTMSAQSSGVNGPSDFGQTTQQQAINATAPVDLAPNGAVKPPPGTSTEEVKNWFQKLDPKVQSTILQTGAGAASGLFQGWSADQRQALEREKFNLDKEKYSTAITNASAQPTIKFAPVGIINSQLKA